MNLGKEAAGFATELGDLLNGTIATGIRLTSVLVRGTAVVRYQIRATDLTTVGIPVTLGSKQPTGYLGLSFRLVPDEHKQFLMVQSSVAGFFVEAQLDRPLMHYDYERDKGGGYPAPRWVVERTFGWLVRNRRLARDYERLTTTSETMIKIAMIRLMATRLAGQNTTTWTNATEREAHRESQLSPCRCGWARRRSANHRVADPTSAQTARYSVLHEIGDPPGDAQQQWRDLAGSRGG